MHWDGCLNARHLGGFVTEDGRVTSSAALVRSDNLARLTPAGRDALVADGVSTVIDLRFRQELEKEPNPFASHNFDSRIAYHHLPLMTTERAEAIALVRAAETTQDAYRATLEGFQANVGEIMKAIAGSAPGRIVMHCSAGKDRTGLIAALALRLVGVSRQDIAEDYLMTNTCLQASYDQELALIADPEERARKALDLQLSAAFILETLDHVTEGYGSVAGYLETCGLDNETLERLRRRLLDGTPSHT
jgi:protein-tyrosine phosphatase